MKKISKKKTFIWLTVAAFVVVLGTTSLFIGRQKADYVPYIQFIQSLKSGEVSSVTLSDSEKISFKMKDGSKVYKTDNPRSESFKEEALLHGATVNENGFTVSSVAQMALSFLFFGFAALFIYRGMKKQGVKSAMPIEALTTSGERTSLSFADIAGNEEAKESVSDIVDFIKNPEKYAEYGARMPVGVILYGPPGTGKTLMAKAIAGEAGVPFYAVSGSDFVQMYVGVGASRIRELFKKARASGKAVIFIDEIDALGKKRGGSANGGNDEREQTLNALLTEMSGFGNDSRTNGIVVIAATNRIDTLDDALLRAGRFDRQIEIGLPDLNARKRIISYHANGKPFADDVDFGALARDTVYFSGAMLESLLNEAAILAAKREINVIQGEDVKKAYITVLAGSEKKDRSSISAKDKEITAFHEAGHALMTKIVEPENTVSKITIIPSTKGTGGFVLNIPPDKMYYTKRELEAKVMVNFAGRASEEIIFGEDNVTTGASNDIEKATAIIKDYVTRYCMNAKGRLINSAYFGDMGGVLNESYAIAEALYEKTKEILTNNIELLNKIANALVEKETLDEHELTDILDAA